MVRVLLTGIGGPAGRSLNLQLQARGLEVVGTDMAVVDPPGAGFAQVPAARDDDFLDVLAEIVAAHDVDLVVPTVTEELVVIAAALADRGAYGVFGRRVPVVVAPHRAVAIADDKLATAEYLETAGLGVPVTFGGNGLAEMTEDDLASLGVPWLSKPRSGRGG